MTDLATGTLHPKRELELLAHAGECDVCREAYRHAKEVFAVLDRGVEALVAGEPSPHFAARLRARIADERVSVSTRWNSCAMVASGALAALVLVLILATRFPHHTHSNRSVATNSPAPAPGGSGSMPAPSLQQTPHDLRLSRASGAVHTQLLSQEVLVPGGQLAAALQLSDAVNGGGVAGEQLVAAQNELAKQLEVRPLEIAPLESSDADSTGKGPT